MKTIKIIPPTIIFFICLITFSLWMLSKSEASFILRQPLLSLSQILALWGIILMSINLLLSTRLYFLEKIFGGLDEVYNMHRLIGAIAFIFLIHHPLLLAFQALPQIKTSLLYVLPSGDLSYTLGIAGLYVAIMSFVFMVFIKLPYHFWKLTHKLMGLSFLLASLHVFLISSDVSVFWPLRLYVISFIVLGISASVYTLFLYPFIGPKYLYEVQGTNRILDIVNIVLKPLTLKTIKFIPGQFVYLKFNNKIVGGESHPFSITSGPSQQNLTLSAKIVGDYTSKLPNLNRGDEALIYGPYGRFGMVNHVKTSLWLAGGIGITPFLSLLKSEIIKRTKKDIYFYCIYRQKTEGVFNEDINKLVVKAPWVHFFPWCTLEKKRLTIEQIRNKVDLSKIDAVLLCGPVAMMESMKRQLISLEFPKDKIFFENFSHLE